MGRESRPVGIVEVDGKMRGLGYCEYERGSLIDMYIYVCTTSCDTDTYTGEGRSNGLVALWYKERYLRT